MAEAKTQKNEGSSAVESSTEKSPISYRRRLLVITVMLTLGFFTFIVISSLFSTLISMITSGYRASENIWSDVGFFGAEIVISGIGLFGTVKLARFLREQKKLVDNLEKKKMPEISETEIIGEQSEKLAEDKHQSMLKEIRSWRISLIILGIIHIVSIGFLNAPWGLTLIVVGLFSLFFETSSMFVIYALTLFWAAFSNILSLAPGWIFFAVFQFILSYRVFLKYRMFKQVEDELMDLDQTDQENNLVSSRAARMFPWIGAITGVVSLAGLVIVILTVIAFAFVGSVTEIPAYFDFLIGMAENLSVLAIAVGLASILSGYEPKWLAIFAMITGGITVVIGVFLIFI